MERFVVPVLSSSATSAVTDLLALGPAEVVGVIVDVGRMPGLDGLRDAVLAAGASRCHVIDAREPVAERYGWPALRAGAFGVPGPPIEAAIALPAVAAALVETAGHEAATGVVPWADDPRDRQRLRALLRGLTPTLGLVSVAAAGGPAVAHSLWARVEAGAGGDAGPAARRAAPAALRVGIEQGVPRSLNGVDMAPAELIDSLATVLQHHGLAPRVVRETGGAGVWRVEAPAAWALHEALAAATSRVYDPATAEVAATVAEAYAAIVRDGTWFGPLRRALDGFVERAIEPVTAEVTLRVAGGDIEVQA